MIKVVCGSPVSPYHLITLSLCRRPNRARPSFLPSDPPVSGATYFGSKACKRGGTRPKAITDALRVFGPKLDFAAQRLHKNSESSSSSWPARAGSFFGAKQTATPRKEAGPRKLPMLRAVPWLPSLATGDAAPLNSGTGLRPAGPTLPHAMTTGLE